MIDFIIVATTDLVTNNECIAFHAIDASELAQYQRLAFVF